MGGIICPPPYGVILRPPSSARVKPQKNSLCASRSARNQHCRGVADGGGGVGGPDPRTFENRAGRPPRFENEVAKIRYFSDF